MLRASVRPDRCYGNEATKGGGAREAGVGGASRGLLAPTPYTSQTREVGVWGWRPQVCSSASGHDGHGNRGRSL